MPLCFYLDSKNEENLMNFTEFLNMINNLTQFIFDQYKLYGIVIALKHLLR